MRSFIRKLAAGTLLCSMTFAQVPAWNVPKVQIKAEEVKAQETSAVRLTCRQAYVITLKKGWDAKDCTFKSEDESVVLVSKEGVIFGISAGTTNVVVTHKTGDSFSCKVDVDAMEPPELKEEIILLARIYERVENVPYQEEGSRKTKSQKAWKSNSNCKMQWSKENLCRNCKKIMNIQIWCK